MRRSRLISLATAGYGVFALVRPGHLPRLLEADAEDREGLEVLARAYGARDLTVSAAALLGRSDRTVDVAMLLRVAMDLGDAAVLGTHTRGRVRHKVLAATLGWAGLNTLVLLDDLRRTRA